MTLPPCPACGAAADAWCHRHDRTQPGFTLMCPPRLRLTRPPTTEQEPKGGRP